MGYSDFSDIISIAMANNPAQAGIIRKLDALSSTTKLAIEWDPVPDSATPGGNILFYSIYIDDGLSGDFVLGSKVGSSITSIVFD